ncbi:MAG TPA: DUF429 domain-containing protein [Anaeromyxobacteraceae bacterium]|nr:DUF429 domain-containing protein [Anaeromyxobacteraceae bacterium]
MVRASDADGDRPVPPGRCPPPKVKMPEKGNFLGVAWTGAQGAGSQIVAARLACEPDRVRLVRLWKPFLDAPSRRGVIERLPAFLDGEVRSADRRLTVGVDFPLALAETTLRQLGLYRQAIAGPRALGKALAERYLPPGVDLGTGAEAVRAEIGRDRSRVTECYRAVAPPAGRNARLRRALLGIVGIAGLDVDVLPWDQPRAGRPAVVEVHPPHLPRALAGICGYRDGEGEGRPALRAAILRTLRSAARVRFEMEDAAELVGDGTGATLDALLAAVAAASARQGAFRQVPHDAPLCEGWIYSIPEEPWRG